MKLVQNRFVQLFFSLALAAIFLATVILGINVFVSHPDFNKERNRCYEAFSPKPVAVSPSAELQATPAQAAEDEKIRRQQEESQACADKIDSQEKDFVQKAFLISVIVGVLGVALGVIVFSKILPLAASGITFGGLLSILYGMIRGLGEVDRRWMFAAAILALVILIFVAWWHSRGSPTVATEKKS